MPWSTLNNLIINQYVLQYRIFYNPDKVGASAASAQSAGWCGAWDARGTWLEAV